MENRVYYGEYSVRRWINLVLAKNVVLPDYQRSFVWDREKVATLIETLREKRFVPPIILGACVKSDGASLNYVIDGQQRLSSLVLAYIKKFPKKSAFPSGLGLASDEEVHSDDEDMPDIGRDWTFRDVATGIVEDAAQLSARCSVEKYDEMDVSFDGVDLDRTFIGFCYLVPGADKEDDIIRYFTRTFREVNIGGVSLSPLESRRALYFLKNDKEEFFEPEWCARYSLLIKGKTVKKQILDFVRYTALLFDYRKHQDDVNRVARGRRRDMEKYFEEFVYVMVDNIKSDVFSRFSDVFKNSVFKPDLQRLSDEIHRLSLPCEYDSIIDMDVYFMGLIYVTLIEKKCLVENKIATLNTELSNLIARYRRDTSHSRSPGALKYLRARLAASVAAFKKAI